MTHPRDNPEFKENANTQEGSHINWVIVAKGFTCLPVSTWAHSLWPLSSSLGCSDLEGDVEPPPSLPLRPALLRAGPEQWFPALLKTSETQPMHIPLLGACRSANPGLQVWVILSLRPFSVRTVHLPKALQHTAMVTNSSFLGPVSSPHWAISLHPVT